MGARHSGHPRSVNMENQTPIGVIDVSDEVVQRLKIGLTKEKQQPTSVSPSREEYVSPPQQPSAASQSPILYREPTISAIEVRRQKELELQQNDLYWRKRMSQLEQTLNKTNAIMEKEYSAAVEDVRKRFTNASPTHQLPPCQEFKAQLIACYRTNPNETLKCSDEVAAFSNCVSENRVKKLDAAAPNVDAAKGKLSLAENKKTQAPKAA